MAPPVIIGAGLAGLTVALAMAPRPVVVIGRFGARRQTSSELAQGGIAAAVGADDSIENHVRDTLAAGAGLCNEAAVRSIIGEGPRAIEKLLSWGVVFDREADGGLRLGLEAAHSQRRIVHATGDSTGASIMQAMLARIRQTPSIQVIEGAEVIGLSQDGAGISGVSYALGEDVKEIETRQVVLATGSACGLWRSTSVPLTSWGHGLLLGARAGAALEDLEFVQFHPTGLDTGLDPLPLISEALRGEGATLVTGAGTRFVDEMAPRDVVARAIQERREAGASVFLDARKVHDFYARFPTIAEICRTAGLDPLRDPLPVRPVAHYHMGGIATDLQGCTNVSGLWACGEVARTGLHGANRLASNSLLEAVVMGLRVAGQMEKETPRQDITAYALPIMQTRGEDQTLLEVRQIMSQDVGVARHKTGLLDAVSRLGALAAKSDPAFVALMIARAALMRTESKGGHYRTDAEKTGVS